MFDVCLRYIVWRKIAELIWFCRCRRCGRRLGRRLRIAVYHLRWQPVDGIGCHKTAGRLLYNAQPVALVLTFNFPPHLFTFTARHAESPQLLRRFPARGIYLLLIFAKRRHLAPRKLLHRCAYLDCVLKTTRQTGELSAFDHKMKRIEKEIKL